MFVTPSFAQEAADEAVEAGAHTETAVAGHEAPAAAFPPFDATTFPSQLLWLAITFGLFYLFMQRVIVPRIGNILEVRRDRIAHDLDQAARNKEEADAAIAAYEQELAEARGKAGAIAQEAQDAAKADAEAERKAVEAELDRKLVEAERRIASIKDAAMKDVDTIAADTAASIVETLIDQKPDDTAVSSAVASVR